MHGFFTLRLVVTRPYFLSEGQFGQWYYRILEIIPISIKPYALIAIFTALPLVILAFALFWQTHRRGRRGWVVASVLILTAGLTSSISHFKTQPKPKVATGGKPMNVIIIASDSLRGDMLGCAGLQARAFRRSRQGRSLPGHRCPRCGIHAFRALLHLDRFDHGIRRAADVVDVSPEPRHPADVSESGDRRGNEEAGDPLPTLLRERGYDTAAIGDWCAGYYEVVGLGMEHLSVSTYDNFKIYMSQAVVMAHFVVPLYFDNPLGYRIFPQLESFANFVTPEVVTKRVEKRLAGAANGQKPFFWHVFYSCNHLPYRSPEPFRSMFADPDYHGPNRNGVAFDIDTFIGGTDLQSKWEALPPKEMKQIRALYDGCTRQFDGCVERILASIKANGLEENTIVIITSDHGDDQYEPGVTLGHGLTLNGGLQANHVPLIVHVPGSPPRVIPEIVRMIDIIPTLADFLGQEKPAIWQGKSFAGWIRNTEKPVHRPFMPKPDFPSSSSE